MKKSYIFIPTFALLALLGAGTASAYGGPNNNFKANSFNVGCNRNSVENITQKAQILGITVEEFKTYQAKGMNMMQIAKEKGLNEQDIKNKMKEFRLAEYKTQLADLVSQGKITQAQADQRLEKFKNNDDKKFLGENKGRSQNKFKFKNKSN